VLQKPGVSEAAWLRIIPGVIGRRAPEDQTDQVLGAAESRRGVLEDILDHTRNPAGIAAIDPDDIHLGFGHIPLLTACRLLHGDLQMIYIPGDVVSR
jgi:hypothetical protein